MSTPHDPHADGGNTPGNWYEPQPQWNQQNDQQNDQQSDQPWDQPQQPWSPQPAGKPRGKGRAVALGVAAVVVIGGAVGTYAAVESGGGSGNSSPKAAVQSFVGDLQKSDLLGILNDLPPSERDAISTPFTTTLQQLKRNDVIASDASLSKISGITVKTSNLTYGANPVVINDHVQVVEITGGTATINADALQLPLTSDVLDGIRKSSNGDTTDTETVNFAKLAKKNHHPLRIATEKVGDSWYPSLLYTIADNATIESGAKTPSSADAIPADGAASADAAVKTVANDLLDGNVRGALALSSPTEDAVLHDYGPLIVKHVHYPAVGTKLTGLAFHDTAVDGGTNVSLSAVTVHLKGAGTVHASTDGSCYSVTVAGHTTKVCPATALKQFAASADTSLTPRQLTAITDLLSNLSKLGLHTSQTDGKWYVDPIRTYDSLTTTLLSGLKNDDGKVLVELIKNS